ncbi:MAG: hypothetical protein LC104_13895 [Bacteroidales bacterium]|nr:hypothetical protein [Bacteroidales bacterium]
MASGADVRSIQAMRDWLADLATYRSDVSESLAGVAMEIRRGLDWLEEQLQFWQRAVRQCEDDVHQAKMELAQRKTPDWSGREPDTTLQVKALRRAQARLEHAEDQVQKCKAWLVRLPKAIDETYSGPAARLQALLDGELPSGMTALSRQIDALEKYTGTQRDFGTLPPSVRPKRESSS